MLCCHSYAREGTVQRDGIQSMYLVPINSFLSRYFAVIFCMSFMVAMSCPWLGRIPAETMIIALAAQIFCACFKIERADVTSAPVLVALLFYLARFVLLPLAAFFLIADFAGIYSWAVLLFLLLPAASAGPSFTALFNGSVPVALLLTCVSSLLAPFLLPLVFHELGGRELHLDRLAMFRTIALLIFLPVMLYGVVRKVRPVGCWIRENNALLVVPLCTYTGMVAIAKKREFILENLSAVLPLLFIVTATYLALFALTWKALTRLPRKIRLAFSISASLNNITLGVVLAMLHFQSEVVVFMLAANVAWVLGLIPIQYWLSRTKITSNKDLVCSAIK